MRLLLIVFLLCLLEFSSVNGQFGFLTNIINRFNPFRPQPTKRPSSSRPSAPVFSRPPSRPSSSPSTTFQSPSSPSTETRQPKKINDNQTGNSRGVGNHKWQGKDYLLSWREGRRSFSWSSARSYCSGRGMKMISLDSASKADHFMKQVAADGESYFWAGGRLSSNKASLTWENGKTERISRGRHPWSFAGLRGPQPDGQGTEHCLAILNNIYKDGVKFHDVGCSHTKPTVCEA